MAFVRNHYVGRSFLQPSQLIRDFNVRVKLNLITQLVKDKRVIVWTIPLSAARPARPASTISRKPAQKRCMFLVSCPPHMNPCVYGIDFSRPEQINGGQLFARRIRKYLNADSLHYLSKEGMVQATGLPKESFLHGLLRRRLPVPYDPAVDKDIIERRNGRRPKLADALAKERPRSNCSEGSAATGQKAERGTSSGPQQRGASLAARNIPEGTRL